MKNFRIYKGGVFISVFNKTKTKKFGNLSYKSLVIHTSCTEGVKRILAEKQKYKGFNTNGSKFTVCNTRSLELKYSQNRLG